VTLSGKRARGIIAAAVAVILSAGLGLLLCEFKFGSGLARTSYDLLHVWRGNVPVSEAAIVYLDEISHRNLNQPLNIPWDRAIHARLVDRLSAAGARAIVFDIVFADPDARYPANDTLFAAAIKRSGRVILAADRIAEGEKTARIDPPIDLLRDSAVDIGSDEVPVDSDLELRREPVGDQLSVMAWAAATLLKTPITIDQQNEKKERWMNYYGPPNFIPWRSYYQVLDPGTAIDSFVSNKVVFVGARIQTKLGSDRKDEYPSPFTRQLSEGGAVEGGTIFCAGVEIQATAFLNLFRGDWNRRMQHPAELAVIFLTGLALGFGLLRLPPKWAALAALASLVLLLASSYVAFRFGRFWFPWMIIAVQIGVALAWSILYNSIQLYVEKRLYEQTLRLYLPPALVRKFSSSKELLRPGATKQTLTLMFSDIANFTTISEGMDSDHLAAMMNEYFEGAVAGCIHKAEGTVAKYIGDAIFAFWNAPDGQADHQLRACQAALMFREHSQRPVHGRTLTTRLGLHTGEVNVGNFGSEERVDYTALGENVNLASRLEGLNKHLGTICLISGQTRAGVSDRLVIRPLGKFQLKGFEGLVEVHELIDWPENAAESRVWREAFAEALNNFEQRNLEFAEIGFQRVLELRPGDGPSKFYIERVKELSAQILPDNWATHTILKEK
jgi:adenylate cyclase